MGTPRSYNLNRDSFAPRLISGGARALWVGDSISNPNTSASLDASQSSMYQGWIRNWPWAWGGIMVPGSGGGGLAIRTGGTGIGTTTRNPNETFDGSVSNFNTHPRQDNSFGTTVADGTNIFGSYVIPGFTVQTSLASIFADVATRVSAAMLTHANGAASVRLDMRRVDSSGSGAVSKATTSGVTLNASRGVVKLSGNIAVHAGGTRPYPDCFIEMDGASNTNAQSAHCLGIWFDRSDLTSALKLFGGGVGGSDSANWLHTSDADAAAQTYIDDGALLGYCAATEIDTVFVQLGANESGQLTTAGYRTRMEKIAQRWYAAMTAAGVSSPVVIFVVNYACPNFSLANSANQAEVLYDIARTGISARSAPSGSSMTYGAVPASALGMLDLSALIVRGGAVTNAIDSNGTLIANGSGGTYLVDNIHPTRLGADYIMGLVFDEFESPSTGINVDDSARGLGRGTFRRL